MAELALEHVGKVYRNGYEAIHDFSLEIKEGELLILGGPTGCGKSTLLRMIAGLEDISSGELWVDGEIENYKEPRERNLAMVFQNYALFRYMTVYDNVAFGLKVQKVDKKTIDTRIRELVKLVGLEGLEKRYPSQLSGGLRQRVAFARALAPNPLVLPLDEPFAAIDAKIRQELRSWRKEMIEKLGITSIFVTHDQDEAVEVADEFIITNHGHIEQMGTPAEIYKSPDTPFVAQFIGRPSSIEAYDTLNGFDRIEGAKMAGVRP